MIIQRTYTSRLFKLKARVGRFRTGLADNLQEKINNHVKRNDTANRIAEKLPGVKDKNLLGSLIESSRENNNILTLPSSYSSTNPNVTSIEKNSKGQFFIFKKPSDGVDSYAHELGHYENIKKDRLLGRLGRNKNTRTRLQNSLNTAGSIEDLKNYKNNLVKSNPGISDSKLMALVNEEKKNRINKLRQSGKLDTGTGIGESIKRMFEGNAVVREERRASKNAGSILKKIGASDNQIKDGNKKLSYLLQTYKENAKIHVLNPIQNKIQIPSRRRST